MTLTETTLHEISYNRDHCRTGIVHVGVGAFHRSHQAAYIDELLSIEGQQDWGIVGVNLRSQESPILEQLVEQDHRYVLKTVSSEGAASFREIGSILTTYDWSVDQLVAANIVGSEYVHMITLTVSESGYYLFDDGALDLNSPPIKEGVHHGSGSSIYTYLRAALTVRRDLGGAPITVLSCDNLRHNGDKLKSGFEQFLRACSDDALLAWVAVNVTFPNCMVDRITPRMEPSHALEVREKFNVDDQLTVMSESFVQWVIEDKFAGKRPPLELVGVEVVKDIEPYEEAKIRILNGAHTVVAYLAALKSYETFDAAIRDPELYELLSGYQLKEVIPTMDNSPIDLVKYSEVVKQRFLNKNIADSIARICADGVSKFSIFILITLKNTYAKGIVPHNVIRGVASWYVFMQHVDKQKIPFFYGEPKWEFIQPLLELGCAVKFSESSILWGDLPIKHPEFVFSLVDEINNISDRFL
ncbi:Mannitol-1-phosphate/altronate dehydrogenase [gamma proteobacterium IMCC1989]|nr:Mannitol-1-phosphate/altronate dehydrogenase [gamma proteobacterium IMCC1989]